MLEGVTIYLLWVAHQLTVQVLVEHLDVSRVDAQVGLLQVTDLLQFLDVQWLPESKSTGFKLMTSSESFLKSKHFLDTTLEHYSS